MPLELLVVKQPREDEDDDLALPALVRRFEEAEENSHEARKLSEQDRDYADGKQLTSEQLAELSRRGQPAPIVNRIKRKVDFFVGLEKQQRTKPRALPRTPQHEQDAEACSDALNYVVDDCDYKMIRSAVWREILVEGTGAAEVCVEGYDDSYSGDANEICIEIRRFPWDRFFADPHSRERDFSDASYLGGVWWMDYEDALERWPDGKDALDATIDSAANTETYDDKPNAKVWADRKRKRVRICQIWIKHGSNYKVQWHFAEFTKGGILKEGPSPYQTDDGDSDCGIFAQSAYVTRDGDRYGAVREMISPQELINKGYSKLGHLINTNQIMYEEGSVDDLEKARTEAARPDGVIKVAPGALAEQRFQFRERIDLAAAHVQLLQEMKSEIDMMGPNASMQGEAGDTASGRAIMASQQGGMIEMGDLLDSLRYFDKRIYRAVWNRIRQYWTGQKWIRVTDDERNIRFASVNKPAMVNLPMPDGQQIQVPDIDPMTGQQRIENNLAQAQVDIIIDDVSDVVAPQIEQWQALVELKKVDVNNELSFKTLIQSAPNLRNKDLILEEMEQREQAAAQAGQAPSPEELALQLKQQEAELEGQRKEREGQQKLQQSAQEHQQKLAQASAEHQQQMSQKEREAELQASLDMRKAQLEAQTQARLMEQKQSHELAGEARKQEVAGFYEGEKQKQALRHDGEREQVKQRAEAKKVEQKSSAESALLDRLEKLIAEVQKLKTPSQPKHRPSRSAT